MCSGGANFYGHYYHCDERHGMVDIHNAIPMSCDTFYYTLGDRLGIGRISKYATAFGYGQKTGIDLPGEQPGLMPSEQWMMKNYHRKWYAGETISVAIGQGAVEATPMQLARIIGGIASGGHMVRPHVVFPDQLPEDFRKALPDSFPGTGQADIPLDSENWVTITDGMFEVTQPGLYHTAGSAHLEGIDFGGKTGTAQVVGHDALSHMAKSKNNLPNVWFVGVTPRRNPELVIAVLWQNGEFSYYPARIAAKIVSAYVEKKRRLDHNLVPAKPDAPVEMGAVWTTPDGSTAAKDGKAAPSSAKGSQPAPGAAAAEHIQAGHFLVDHGQIVSAKVATPSGAAKTATAGAQPAAASLQTGRPQPARPVKGQ